MPAVVGFVKVVSVGSGSIVQFGDTLQISPSSNSKTYAGSGSFLTGSLTNSNNAVSATNSLDPDLQDNTNVPNGANLI
ncbi:spore germination protein [Paenibacillus sp. J5C_2022]|uniref:Spore germination protein n=1 Tax=Paenibacillus chungangensis TaxID=696535 RepID=A0ABW3HMI5_9BACL|nr:spore germination protein [Paenibacillus sp. J5C2022]MCU6707709.1 spore germination protein [Paenibacillus sp. J5C2022]